MSVNLIFILFFAKLQHGTAYLSSEDAIKVTDALSAYVTVEPTKYVTNDNYNDFHQKLVIKNPDKGDSYNFQKNIYAYDNTHKTRTELSNSFNMLYTFFNCETGRWIKNRIYLLLTDVPLLTSFEHITTNNNVFINGFNENDKFKEFVNYIDKFLSKLRVFINVESLKVSSNETTILHVLYQLKFKIRYFNSLREKNTSKHTDDIVIREFFDIINKIHNYMLTNCPFEDLPTLPLNTESKTKMYGYSIDVMTDTLQNINEMMEDTSFLDFKSDICTVDQMLLRNIVYYEGNDTTMQCITNSIRSAKTILSGETQRITIKNIYERIEQTYDVETIFFYQKSILNVIIVIVHSLLDSFFLKPKNEVITSVSDVQKKLKNNVAKFPTALIDYFNFLRTALETSLSLDQTLAHLKHDYADSFDSIKLANFHPNCSFNEFMSAIIKMDNDMECFNEHFKLLREEYGRDYMPFIVDSSVRKYVRPTSVPDIDKRYHYNSKMCVYINIMYSRCAKVVDSLSEYKENISNYLTNKTAILFTCNEFESIKQYFFRIIKSHVTDHNVLKIAYNAFILMVNVKCVQEENYIENVERTLYFLMTELNDFGLNYCHSRPESPGFLIHQNVNVHDIKDSPKLKITLAYLLKTTIEMLEEEIPIFEYEHYDLNFMYKTYVEKSQVVPKYEKFIKFYWKGEVISFHDMCQYAVSNIALNYRFLYVFYDIYFNIFIAAFFWEIDVFSRIFNKSLCVNYLSYKNHILYVETLELFSNNFFPKSLRSFIKKIKIFAYDLLEEDLNAECVMLKSDRIKKQFNDHFIVLNPPDDSTGIYNHEDFDGGLSVFSENVKFILKELNDKVKPVLEKYLLIHKLNENEYNSRYTFKV